MWYNKSKQVVIPFPFLDIRPNKTYKSSVSIEVRAILVNKLGQIIMAAKLYVGGLAYSVNDNELNAFFAEVGKVISAVVIKDRDSGQSKGFGFVEMENDSDAKTAIETLNGKDLSGRSITVSEARPQEDRRSSGGGGGGGGFRKSY